jgi:hypothetical protein
MRCPVCNANLRKHKGIVCPSCGSMTRKWSSRPRKVLVTHKLTGVSQTFDSVSECARGIGKGREHVHAMLSGRSGKRSTLKIEYA